MFLLSTNNFIYLFTIFDIILNFHEVNARSRFVWRIAAAVQSRNAALILEVRGRVLPKLSAY